MPMFLHIFYTWLLSNFFHLFVFITLSMIRDHSVYIPGPGDFSIGVLILGASLIASVPCLLLGWLCLYIINTSLYPGGIKFILWLATGPSLVFFEFLFVLFVTDQMDIELFLFSIPAITAVGLAILIRYGQFRKLTCSTKLNNHEANLV